MMRLLDRQRRSGLGKPSLVRCHLGWVRLAVLAAVLILWPMATAMAEPRLALIVGNSDYGAELGRLPNPANDAAMMSSALKSVGFETITLIDADQKSLKRAISDFGQRLNALGSEATGLFFYAGHGLQVKGTNYLVPVRADIRTEADIDLEAVAADTVLAQMEYAGARVNIVILDACRNNPLSRGFRSATRGLAKMDAPKGSFIAYSTAPGDVAADGTGANSPYTSALAASLKTPGKGIEEMFRDVRGAVLASTGQMQTPWESSSLTAPFYFAPPVASAEAMTADDSGGTATTPGAPTQTAAIDPIEKEYWEAAKTSDDPADSEAYLARYPNGEFAPLARNRLERLKSRSIEQAGTAAPDAAPPIDPGANIVALQQVVYAASKANVRSAPNKNATVLTQLPKNTELKATGRTADGGWWRVSLEGGAVGYVHQSIIADQPAPPPVAAAQQTQAPTAAPAAAPAAAGAADTPADAPASTNENYAAAPAMNDSGTTTEEVVVTESNAGEQVVGAAIGSFLGGLVGGQQGTITLPPPSSTSTVKAPPDPATADKLIVSQLRSGNVNGALKSANKAQGDDAGFWSKAAMMAFYLNKRADLAANMARRSISDNAGYLYGWIWVALGEAAQGQAGQAAGSAQAGLADFGQNAWPAPIAEFMAGERTADSLMALAKKGGARAVCEAGFYGGAFMKATGDPKAATLLNAAKAGGSSCLESVGAQKLR